MLTINKENLAGRAWRARIEAETASEAYLEAYGKFIEADESYKDAKARAIATSEGKNSAVRQAVAFLNVTKEFASRNEAKRELEKQVINRDRLRLYSRVLNSVLRASGGSASLYPIEDKIPDPMTEIDHAHGELAKANEEYLKALKNYMQSDFLYQLRKSAAIVNGIPGKNEEERRANLRLDPEINDAAKQRAQDKLALEIAETQREIARDSLKFWLSYMRSLGLDEDLVDEPGRMTRQ